MFNSGSQANLISEYLVNNLVLETWNHPIPYPLGWLNKSTQIKVTKQCRLRFSITANYIDKVELDVVPIDICGVVLGSPYLYDRDAIFYKRETKYHLKKDGVEVIVRAHQSKNHLNLVVSNQMKQLISSNKRFIIMCVRNNIRINMMFFQVMSLSLKIV